MAPTLAARFGNTSTPNPTGGTGRGWAPIPGKLEGHGPGCALPSGGPPPRPACGAQHLMRTFASKFLQRCWPGNHGRVFSGGGRVLPGRPQSRRTVQRARINRQYLGDNGQLVSRRGGTCGIRQARAPSGGRGWGLGPGPLCSGLMSWKTQLRFSAVKIVSGQWIT